MKSITRDARVFVDELAKYVGQHKEGKIVGPRVQALLGRVTTAAQKERVASVQTVVTLTGEEKELIARMLNKILGHAVECNFSVNESLLGGMKIQVADWVVDTSLSTQLSAMIGTIL